MLRFDHIFEYPSSATTVLINPTTMASGPQPPKHELYHIKVNAELESLTKQFFPLFSQFRSYGCRSCIMASVLFKSFLSPSNYMRC